MPVIQLLRSTFNKALYIRPANQIFRHGFNKGSCCKSSDVNPNLKTK